MPPPPRLAGYSYWFIHIYLWSLFRTCSHQEELANIVRHLDNLPRLAALESYTKADDLGGFLLYFFSKLSNSWHTTRDYTKYSTHAFIHIYFVFKNDSVLAEDTGHKYTCINQQG